MKIKTNNLSDLEKFANKISKLIKGFETILLFGELASGKTTFTKYLAKALKFKSTITSPSFNVMKSYNNKKYTLNHFDLYRLDNNNLNDIDLSDYLENSISIIEWPLNYKKIIPNNYLKLSFTYLSENEREINIEAKGAYYQKFLNINV